MRPKFCPKSIAIGVLLGAVLLYVALRIPSIGSAILKTIPTPAPAPVKK